MANPPPERGGSTDPDHWLWRLTPEQWLDAARHELDLGRRAAGLRRRSVTHARRAAGMALNATLVAMASHGYERDHCESVWGRSYVDHLRRLVEGECHPLPPQARDLSQAILEVSVNRPASSLVTLGPGGSREAGDLNTVLGAAERLLALVSEVIPRCPPPL